MADEVLEVAFIGKDELTGVINNISKATKIGLAAAFGVAAGGAALLTKNILTGIESLQRIERINAQTSAVIESTGMAAGFTAEQIEAMAGEFENLTATEAESVQEGANMLLTFTNIGQDVFPDALAAVNDMARAMDKTGSPMLNMQQQAIMVGKALQDPILGISALRRVGVNFNEEAANTIKALVEMGDVAGAQKYILAELANEFGGSAEAFAQTTTGKLELVKHAFGTIQEAIAGPFLDMVGGALQKILPFIQNLADAFNWLFGIIRESGIREVFTLFEDGSSVIGGFLERIGIAAGPAQEIANVLIGIREAIDMIFHAVKWDEVMEWSEFGNAAPEWLREIAYKVADIVFQVRTWIDRIKEFIAPAIEWWKSTVQLKDVLTALGIFIAATLIPIIVSLAVSVISFVAPILAVIAAVALLRKAWETDFLGIRTKLTEFWEGTGRPIFNTVKEWLEIHIPLAIEVLKDFWLNTLLPAIQTVWGWISNVLIPFFRDTVVPWLRDRITQAIEVLRHFWEEILLPGIQRVWTWIQTVLIPFFQTVIVPWLQEKIPAAIEVLRSFWEETLLPAINKVWDFIKVNLVPLFEAVVELVGTTLKLALEVLAGIWENVLKPALEAVWGFIKDNVIPVLSDLWDWISEKLSPVVEAIKSKFDAVGSSIGGITGAIQSVIGWISNLTDKLRNIQLPSWLQSNSPTPFELGLRGISSAMKELAYQTPTLRATISTANLAAAGSTTNYYLNATYTEYQSFGSLVSDVKMMNLLAR